MSFVSKEKQIPLNWLKWKTNKTNSFHFLILFYRNIPNFYLGQFMKINALLSKSGEWKKMLSLYIKLIK